MSATYDVTLTHFSIVEGVAKASPGSTKLHEVGSLELLQIMMIFQDINPIQHFEGDPVISIYSKQGAKFLVRTDLNRLILSDVRDPLQPSRVVEAASILLELEDKAGRLRKEVSLHVAVAAQEQDRLRHAKAADDLAHFRAAEASPTGSPRLSYAALLLSVVVFAVAWFLRTEVPAPAPPAIDWIETPAEVLRLRHGLLGTYATGRGAGDYALVITHGDSLRLLELGDSPPAELRRSYRLGRLGDRLLLQIPGLESVLVEGNRLRMGPLVFTKQ